MILAFTTQLPTSDPRLCISFFPSFLFEMKLTKKSIRFNRHVKRRIHLYILRIDHVFVVLHRGFLWF